MNQIKIIALLIFTIPAISHAQKTGSPFHWGDKLRLVASTNGVYKSDGRPFTQAEFNLMNGDAPFLLLSDSTNNLESYHWGLLEGKVYYKDKGPFWGGFFLGLIAPVTFGGSILGTIPIVTSEPRNLDNPLNPNNNLLLQADYGRGFREAAKRKKTGKTFAGFGIGLGVGLTAVVIWFFTSFGPSISS